MRIIRFETITSGMVIDWFEYKEDNNGHLFYRDNTSTNWVSASTNCKDIDDVIKSPLTRGYKLISDIDQYGYRIVNGVTVKMGENMIRISLITDTTIWYEWRQGMGEVQQRNYMSPTWTREIIYKTMDSIRKEYQNSPVYFYKEFTEDSPLIFDSDFNIWKLPEETQNLSKKCDCPWREVYMHGCQKGHN